MSIEGMKSPGESYLSKCFIWPSREEDLGAGVDVDGSFSFQPKGLDPMKSPCGLITPQPPEGSGLDLRGASPRNNSTTCKKMHMILM
ncbi:Protein SKT5 [Fusarium oxysporum f. sp. albedinis]|nr:Protein SKT5 [Fusarium oxysporum f. sp. albedinis]